MARPASRMLDFCAEHNITADVEVLPAAAVNDAFDRLKRNDVQFRFTRVILAMKGDQLGVYEPYDGNTVMTLSTTRSPREAAAMTDKGWSWGWQRCGRYE